MNLRPLTSNAAACLQALNAPGAVLAFLVWAILLSTARANDAPPPAAGQSQPAVATATDLDSLPPFPAEEPQHDPASISDPAAGCDSVVIEDGTTSKPTLWPPGGSAQPEPMWKRMWRWAPQGMIPYFGRTPDSQKHRGIGWPLEGRGWRSQPFYISTFAGATDGGALIPGHVNQLPSFYGGINIGWNYDHYWGIEKRLGFGALSLSNGNHQTLPNTGASVTGEYRLMYYPLGDARWRPFLTAGVGWSDFYFNDDHGSRHLDTVGMIPFGVGLKYLCNDRVAVRVDLIDEMTFGDGVVSNFHYLALTAGLEFRYGHRLLNMPWHKKMADDGN